MPLDSASTIGAAVRAAITGITIDPTAPITNDKLDEIWEAVAQKLQIDQMAKADVAPGTFASTVPVVGIGGPVS